MSDHRCGRYEFLTKFVSSVWRYALDPNISLKHVEVCRTDIRVERISPHEKHELHEKFITTTTMVEHIYPKVIPSIHQINSHKQRNYMGIKAKQFNYNMPTTGADVVQNYSLGTTVIKLNE